MNKKVISEQVKKYKKLSLDKLKTYLEVAMLCGACLAGVWKVALHPLIVRMEQRAEARITEITDKIINEELFYVHSLFYLSTTSAQRDSATILYKNYIESIKRQEEYEGNSYE